MATCVAPASRNSASRALHADHVRRRALTFLDRADESGAQCADRCCARTERFQCGGEQLHDGRLAVRAGDADHLQLDGWTSEKPRGDFTEMFAQAIHGDNVRIPILKNGGRRCFSQYHRSTARQRRRGKRDSVRCRALQRDEDIAGLDVSRIEREAVYYDVASGIDRCDSCEKIGQTRAHGTSSAASSLDISAAAGCAGTAGPPANQCCTLSGGTSRMRNAPSMTLAKTGAETKPPK